MSKITETPEFESFFNGCQQIIDDADVFGNPYLVIRPGGRKFIAIDRQRGEGDDISIFCFIAAEDGFTKFMGSYQRGDVMRAAGYKKPAKHARGNIFDAHNGLRHISWTGPAYLK
jgi:hypothetical protein